MGEDEIEKITLTNRGTSDLTITCPQETLIGRYAITAHPAELKVVCVHLSRARSRAMRADVRASMRTQKARGQKVLEFRARCFARQLETCVLLRVRSSSSRAAEDLVWLAVRPKVRQWRRRRRRRQSVTQQRSTPCQRRRWRWRMWCVAYRYLRTTQTIEQRPKRAATGAAPIPRIAVPQRGEA